MADRIGVISHGEIILVEDKKTLMRKLGKKEIALHFDAPLREIPAMLAAYPLALSDEGRTLAYAYDIKEETAGVSDFLDAVTKAGLVFKDLETSQSSLEDIFVDLVKKRS
jgi:ABC-2 type transport system ATP-binding protein